ncbi:MAG: ATP-binding protein [Hormoscilla sp. GM7CHS1pb]|nr:ATP-binding protein [Hormoscilla sp. GM7CHS1pb]
MESLKVSGKLESLSAIAKYVMAAASSAGLDKKASYKLRLAVDEIATNIITHGYEEAGREGDVELQAKIEEKTLTIWIEDTGEAYDPIQIETVEEEMLNKPLEERPIGGLGLYLAIEGVDKFLYERVEDHNRNIFVVNRPSISCYNAEEKEIE